ncbi:MAG: sigma-70 family RNA polymerase sigma factor, partial [Pirellulales bacterium]|nr:sigma-70 family RNA polymerase sigma factor [Pirellulales bacterium]
MSGFLERLQRARDGQVAELEAIFAKWRPILRAQAHRLLGQRFTSRADSSDLVQDAMAQAFRRIDQFYGQTEAQFGAWLQQILTREASRNRKLNLAAKRTVLREENVDYKLFCDPPAATSADDADSILQVARIIDGFPDEMRDVVFRRAFHGQSFQQIAEVKQR